MKTVLIRHDSDDPAFNLAAEDYFLHQFEAQVVFLYVNKPCVVVGKHQNAFKEVNWQFCKQHQIAVHRRLSGGGTVYHAPGNLNFCFITNSKHQDKMIDFKKQLEPVNQFLHSINVPSEYSGRNDLLVEGLKISGNAEHVYSKKKRVIHHGTLLFDANLSELGNAIRPKTEVVYNSHAVESVRSQVTNIATYLDHTDFNRFNQEFQAFLRDFFNAEDYELSDKDVTEIQALAKTKYSTWEWNWGYSPTFSLSFNKPPHMFSMKVKRGHIESVDCVDCPRPLDALVDTKYWSDTLQAYLPQEVVDLLI